MAAKFMTMDRRTSKNGGVARIILKNINMGVKNGMSERICARFEEGSLMTVKLMMKGMIIKNVTGVDNACASSCEEHIAPTAA